MRSLKTGLVVLALAALGGGVFGVAPVSGQTPNVLNVETVVNGTPPPGDLALDVDCAGMVNNLIFPAPGVQALNPPMATCALTVVESLGATVANTCTVVANPADNFCDADTTARFNTAGGGEVTLTVTFTFADPPPPAPAPAPAPAPVVPATPTFTG